MAIKADQLARSRERAVPGNLRRSTWRPCEKSYALDVLADRREQMFVVSFANEHARPGRTHKVFGPVIGHRRIYILLGEVTVSRASIVPLRLVTVASPALSSHNPTFPPEQFRG